LMRSMDGTMLLDKMQELSVTVPRSELHNTEILVQRWWEEGVMEPILTLMLTLFSEPAI
jgi:hypothetical protein